MFTFGDVQIPETREMLNYTIRVQSTADIKKSMENHVFKQDRAYICTINIGIKSINSATLKRDFERFYRNNILNKFTLIDCFDTVYENCSFVGNPVLEMDPRQKEENTWNIGSEIVWDGFFPANYDLDFIFRGYYDVSVDYETSTVDGYNALGQRFVWQLNQSKRILNFRANYSVDFEAYKILSHWATKLIEYVDIDLGGYGSIHGILDEKSLSLKLVTSEHNYWDTGTMRVVEQFVPSIGFGFNFGYDFGTGYDTVLEPE